MFRRLWEYLKKPYPKPELATWQSAVIAGGIIFLLFWIFQPFGLSEFPLKNRIIWIVLWSLISGVSVYFPNVLYWIFFRRGREDEEDWALWKIIVHISLMLISVTVGVWLSVYIHPYYEIGCSFFRLLLYVFGVGIFPTAFFFFLGERQYLSRHLREAEKLNEILGSRERRPAVEHPGSVSLQDGTREMLTIDPETLLYAKAEQNYVDVVYLDGGAVRRRMIRSTLKQAESAFGNCRCVMRCHRTYIVNILRIVRIDGNSQGYRAVLAAGDTVIPVSRQYIADIRARLESFNA